MRQMLLPVALAAALASALPAHAEAAWPERVVAIEDMQRLTPITIEVPNRRPSGEVTRPVVLRVHVDREGAVQRAWVLQGSGSAGHDTAAMRAMKGVRFAPYVVDGEPQEVTLVVPLHLPKK